MSRSPPLCGERCVTACCERDYALCGKNFDLIASVNEIKTQTIKVANKPSLHPPFGSIARVWSPRQWFTHLSGNILRFLTRISVRLFIFRAQWWERIRIKRDYKLHWARDKWYWFKCPFMTLLTCTISRFILGSSAEPEIAKRAYPGKII